MGKRLYPVSIDEIIQVCAGRASPSDPTTRAKNELGDPFILLPTELAKTIPPLRFQDHPSDPLIYVMWFLPDCSRTWFVSEYDPKTRLCYGIVVDDARQRKARYFCLDDVQLIRSQRGCEMCRNIHWELGQEPELP